MPESLIWTEFPELTRPAAARHRRGTVGDFVRAWGPLPPRGAGDKESLPLVSPAEWPAEGGRSGSAQPVAMHAVVLDFDFTRLERDAEGRRTRVRHEAYLDDAAFLAKLGSSGIPCLDYLTYSAKPDWLKRRVVSALARPCPPARYGALVRLYARALGFEREWVSGAIDASCAESKRIYFAAHDERGLDGARAAFSHAVPQLIPPGSVDPDGDLSDFCWDWSEEELREIEVELNAADGASDEDPRAASAVTDDVLASALAAVDPEDRDVWFRVGSALKTWSLRRHGRDEPGWALWEDWSRRCPAKWDERDARKNWRSFDPERVSAGTIIHLARQAGWKMGEVERLNEQFFTVTVGGTLKVARIVPASEVAEWVPQDLPGIQLETPKTFGARFKEWVPVRTRDEDGAFKEIRKPLGKMWLDSPKRRHYPNGFRFDYRGTDHRDGYYNLFQGFSVHPDPLPHPEQRCARVLAHAREVLCSNDAESYEYLMNWLAWKLQKPSVKLKTAIVVQGRKGVGKDSFFELVTRIIGPRCSFLIDDTKKFEKTFNGFLSNKCLIVMDEANLLAHDVEQKLKHYITQETVTVERKGVDLAMDRNYADFVIYGNNEAMVNVTADERRYFVLQCSDHRRGDERYFDAYHAEIETGGAAEAFCAWLLARDLAGFRPSRIPSTAAHRQQYLLTQVPGMMALRDFLAAPSFWEVDVYVKAGGTRSGRNASWVLASEMESRDGWPLGECAVRRQQLADHLVRVAKGNGGLQRTNTPQRLRAMLDDVFGACGSDRQARLPLPKAERDGRLVTRAEPVYVLPTLDEARHAFEKVAGIRMEWPQ